MNTYIKYSLLYNQYVGIYYILRKNILKNYKGWAETIRFDKNSILSRLVDCIMALDIEDIAVSDILKKLIELDLIIVIKDYSYAYRDLWCCRVRI